METHASYFDGRSSGSRQVVLRIEGSELRLHGTDAKECWPLKDVRLSMPLGSIRRAIYFPDGARCDVEDRHFALRIERIQGRGKFFRGIHSWENSLKLAFTALVLTIALVWGFIQFGIPELAERAAYAVPPVTETDLGQETLGILDKTFLKPSGLDAGRRSELKKLFDRVVLRLDAADRLYRLELRSSPRLGANAFALPGGIVILTDELVALAEHDEEIAAVLAHEVGHVRYRHSMRQVIQNSVVGLLVATLTGDVLSATSMAAALPTMLVDSKFSREMEREADDVAVEYLRREGETADRFASIIARLEKAHAGTAGQDSGGERSRIADYFSTHPATEERIERLRQGR